MKLLSEQVGMCSRPGQFKDEDVLENLVDEKPVWRDMAFAVVGPSSGKGVVAVFRGQRLALASFAITASIMAMSNENHLTRDWNSAYN